MHDDLTRCPAIVMRSKETALRSHLPLCQSPALVLPGIVAEMVVGGLRKTMVPPRLCLTARTLIKVSNTEQHCEGQQQTDFKKFSLSYFFQCLFYAGI